MSQKLLVYDDARQAAEACGWDTLQLLDAARKERGTAFLAVSGGSTPRIMFEWMALQPFDWKEIHLFWVDERCVPADDSQSNYRMTREALLDTVQMLPACLHRVETEYSPVEAAAFYQADLVRTFGLQAGEWPVFDVIQRGMGPDAHTASLFPGDPATEDHTQMCGLVWAPQFHQHRVTLMPGTLERARNTLCLVTGAEKREALKKVLHGPRDPLHVPAQISSPEMVWYLDRLVDPAGQGSGAPDQPLHAA